MSSQTSGPLVRVGVKTALRRRWSAASASVPAAALATKLRRVNLPRTMMSVRMVSSPSPPVIPGNWPAA